MTEKDPNQPFEYLLERRLKDLDPDLHRRFCASVFSIDILLANYKNIFPFFTNHTFEHSEQVIHYCNVIAGEAVVRSLCADEIYILLMGAALHDVGMGISEKDFREFAPKIPALAAFMRENPEYSFGEYTRRYHQDISACFIEKYSHLFDLPSEEHLRGIAAIARGHRKADLLDRSAFPTDYALPNGKTVNLAYLAALVKLADELDVTADRNLFFNYAERNSEWSEKQTMCYKCHGAIKRLEVFDDSLVLLYDTEEESVEREILETKGKVERTFAEYCAVVRERTAFANRLSEIRFEKLPHTAPRGNKNPSE